MTLRGRLQGWLSHDTHPFVQFIKYALAGGLATVVDMLLTFLLGWLVFPALKPDELLVRLLHLHVDPIDTATRAVNFRINSGISFIFSNLTAYITNVLWVFKPGKHSRRKEIALFYAVSLTSLFIGTAAGETVIRMFDLSLAFSYITKMVASLAINYAGRKYLIFKG
jgi:putative flippase GtrA